MSQSSSGLTDLTSPESPPLHEQGLPRDPETNNSEDTNMDTSQMVTAEQLSNSDFLFSHPAPHRLSDPTPEHILYFENLMKEAATLMLKVQKHQSAATNIKSPTWERASLTIEECSRRIRAICTYTGVPAYQLPTKKELAELKKDKELRDKIAAEAQLAANAQQVKDAQQAADDQKAAAAAVTTSDPALPQQPQSATPTSKRKAPASPTPDDDFITVVSKKDRKNRKDRPIKVVLRGLPGHTPIEDIETELRALEFPLSR
ncbi:hypothetical protein CDAR_621461 [Caerostris darwini]|uniref:Uncharacterized protein n=1 Tax=Caerostris darwini TaxID=1538125 RepID=A0AAV4TSV3_9ARAC|nr:hypothetical protein CDAR_621461 [Caerostris darwini]